MLPSLIALTIYPIILAAPRIEFVGVSTELVNGIPLADPQGLAVNSLREEFLVTDALNDRIVIFDSTAAAVFDFSLGEGRNNPFGIAVNSREEILVGSMDTPEVWIFDYSGRYLDTITLPNGVFPGRILCDSTDALYVIDRAGKGIYETDNTGQFVERYASADSNYKPVSLCSDSKGDMILISAGGNVVTGFAPDGKILYKFGEHGRKLEDFSHPAGSLVDDAGDLWVVDSFRHHIKRFGPDHKFIDIIGQRGTAKGEFYFPVDLKVTPLCKLGVLEKGSGRLQVFRMVK
jgi:hypothetical protein